MFFRSLPLFVLCVAVSCGQQACPSGPGDSCDPRNANCPKDYTCAVAEICTRTCEQTSDCWVKVEDGCRPKALPGQRLADGGIASETSEDGFCPESKVMHCLDGYCQFAECADGGCDRDLYGPSGWKGNRSQGPQE